MCRQPVLCALTVLALVAPSVVLAAGWHTSGTAIVAPNGQPYVVSGINWYGFETRDYVAHGMWTKHYGYILDRVKQYGFNTVRIPFSNAMWGTNPLVSRSKVSACPECRDKRSRDVLALIVNYAGSIGLHVILDNHRSTAGNSAEENGLWYTSGYPESVWIRDWLSVQEWSHGVAQTLGAPDTIVVQPLASDGLPVVIGFDLRNEPHSPSTRTSAKYAEGANWGTGDGAAHPNPDPSSLSCVATSKCHDWRLAAQRAGNKLATAAASRGWDLPLIFVEGVSLYPSANGTHASGPYDGYWWGGNLLGVNGNATNAGAPVVLNLLNVDGTIDTAAPVYDQVVYSAHDYGPSLYRQGWFNTSTCYASGCSASSLADVWTRYWAHLSLADGIQPAGWTASTWANTGHTPDTQAPVFIGEFGTANASTDLFSSTRGSQGQWFTNLVNFIRSSVAWSPSNDSGIPVSNLHFTYWSLNDEDAYALLGANYTGLENPQKEYSFLCAIESGPFAVPPGTAPGQCGSTGPLPAPF